MKSKTEESNNKSKNKNIWTWKYTHNSPGRMLYMFIYALVLELLLYLNTHSITAILTFSVIPLYSVGRTLYLFIKDKINSSQKNI